MTANRRMELEVRNWSQLERFLGREVTQAIGREICERAQHAAGQAAEVRVLGEGRFEVALACEGAPGDDRSAASAGLDAFLKRLVAGQDHLVSLAVLGATWMPAGRSKGAQDAGDGLVVSALRIPASQASADLGMVDQVMDALECGRLSFAFQPVVAADDPGTVLYHESLARMIEHDSRRVMLPGSFIPSLERAGAMSRFDQFAVNSMIELLFEDERICLGCNISGQSAVADGRWESVFATLSRRRDVASRLVIEITETAPMVPEDGRRFVSRMKHLGCRIAIDDFGVGFGVKTGIEVGQPDIIKVDASFIAGARAGQAGLRRFRGMVSLARDLAGCIIVEGVEDVDDLAVVRRAGVQWVQGYHFGRPAEQSRPRRMAIGV